MPLKFKIAKKEEVPAEHASLYVEKDGVFLLDVEGAVDKSKLDEFRNTNITLQNQLKTFDGIDAALARELIAKKQQLDEGELLKKGDFGALLEQKLNPIRQSLEAEQKRNVELQNQIAGAKLVEAIQSAGTKAGVRSTALEDLRFRAERRFKVVEGTIVPAQEGGQNLEQWVESLKGEAPHLFEQNSGGGASGNGSGGAGLNGHGNKNPWLKENLNLTEQGRILRSNPTLAAQMKKAAGR